MKKPFSPWPLYLIPVLWLVLGILYARTLDAWVGIGVVILVIISSISLLAGIITWHITRSYWQSILAVTLTTISCFTFVILLARFA